MTRNDLWAHRGPRQGNAKGRVQQTFRSFVRDLFSLPNPRLRSSGSLEARSRKAGLFRVAIQTRWWDGEQRVDATQVLIFNVNRLSSKLAVEAMRNAARADDCAALL